MSVEAVDWALKVATTTEPIHKLVLCALANHAHKDGRNAYCSARTIAHDTGLSLRSVQRYLVALEEDGLIVRGDQAAAESIDPRYRPVVYDLAMPPTKVRQRDVTGPVSYVRNGSQLRQESGLATSLLTYKPRTNQEINPRAELSPSYPPTPTALRAAELAACEHGAPPGRCALCRGVRAV